MTVTINGLDELQQRVGDHLGYSDWVQIDQATIDRFAEATGDQQWSHADPERAAAESPFGGTVAHGNLTLSLIPRLAPLIYRVEGVSMSINYGCDKIRFPAPVPAGAHLRIGAEFHGVDPAGSSAVQVRVLFTFDVRDESAPDLVSTRPACVAEVLFRYVG